MQTFTFSLSLGTLHSDGYSTCKHCISPMPPAKKSLDTFQFTTTSLLMCNKFYANTACHSYHPLVCFVFTLHYTLFNLDDTLINRLSTIYPAVWKLSLCSIQVLEGLKNLERCELAQIFCSEYFIITHGSS